MLNQIEAMKPDFIGYATVYGVECTDGRTIQHGAFKDQHGDKVPLVWRHQHDSMDNVVGHGILEHTDKGVRIHAKFNTTPHGIQAKALVTNGDISFLSVWANKIKQEAANVIHGIIREVSLVLSGANPEAVIESVVVHNMSDNGETFSEGFVIHSGLPIELVTEETESEEDEAITGEDSEEETEEVVEHQSDETLAAIYEGMSEEKKSLITALMHAATRGDKLEVSGDADQDSEGNTIQDVIDSLTEVEKQVLYYMVGSVSEDSTIEQSDDLGEDSMTTHNIFEGQEEQGVLSHEQQTVVLGDAMKAKAGSLGDFVIAHAGTYGIDNVANLFPDAKMVEPGAPVWYGRDQEWVGVLLNSIRKSPFARIKSMYADITADEARAKGYVKEAEKFEEVFPVLTRTTTPQTVYKKQKLDRDDIIDITDFDVVTWLKAEMRVMLLEEIARAILITDGRSPVHADKIVETNVRPIYTDDDIYAHKVEFLPADTILDVIDGITAAHEHYQGSGAPTLFLSPGVLSQMLLLRDGDNHRMYPTVGALKSALRVSEIVEVPLMTGISRVDVTTINLLAIMVNPRDYVLGADKGGRTTFFSDFDIDFNQHKYLYETRVSGALIRPKSAIVFEQDTGA